MSRRPKQASLQTTDNITQINPLGRTLKRSLEVLMSNSSSSSSSNAVLATNTSTANYTNNHSTHIALNISNNQKEDILKELNSCINCEWEKVIDEKLAPAALLKGQVKYYNRFEGNWSLEVTDTQIRARRNLENETSSSSQCGVKKKRKRQSLWDYAAVDNDDNDDGTILKLGEIDLLLYDDNDDEDDEKGDAVKGE